MQDNFIQFQSQPLVKLAQANMELLTRFWTAPEVTSQAAAKATELFQQAAESAMRVMQTGAFAQLSQGLLSNYTDFLTEFSQGAMAMVGQGQAAWMRQAQEASNDVIDATTVRTRRSRQAA